MKKILLLLIFALSIAGCTEDADNACFYCTEPVPSREYKLKFRGHSSSEEQFPVWIFYYVNNGGTLSSVMDTSQTSTDMVYSITLPSYSRIGFKLNIQNGGQALIDTVTITDVESGEVLFENTSLEITSGETFMYNIPENIYTIQ